MFNQSAFEAYCDVEGIAADPDVYGTEFQQNFIGEIDIEDYLRCEIEDREDVPGDLKSYLDYDMMAKDALGSNGNFIQVNSYLFRKG
jgi:hypothetical protein